MFGAKVKEAHIVQAKANKMKWDPLLASEIDPLKKPLAPPRLQKGREGHPQQGFKAGMIHSKVIYIGF